MAGFELDRVFIKRFYALLKVMFPGFLSPTFLLFIFLFALSVLDQVITYFVGIIPSEFYVVLGSKDAAGFEVVAYKSLVVVLAKALTKATTEYSSTVLYVHWRRLLCTKLHQFYFNNQTYYRLNVQEDIIDNPDQRITQDVEKTCRLLGWTNGIFRPLIILPFVIAFYTYKTFVGSGYFGPLAIYAYFVLATIVNKLLMNPKIKYVAEQEKREGDFRFKHMSIRSNAEAIAFSQGADLENVLSSEKLERLLTTQSVLINWEYALTFATNCFDYFGSILSYLIIAISIFWVHMYDDTSPVELTGIVSRNSFFYMYLINSFTQVLDKSSLFSDMAGTAHRVGELLLHMQSGNNKNDLSDSDDDDVVDASRVVIHSKLDDHLKRDHHVACAASLLSYFEPNSSRLLVKDLSFTVETGKYVLVTGDSSSGKTSLFRILAGLWTAKSGEIEIYYDTSPRSVMFLPQKPYFPSGTLRQQIVYPNFIQCSLLDVDDENRIISIIKLLHLEHIMRRVGGLDESNRLNWHDCLSPGEMQRLSFARVLYHKPRFVFLDESTSGVGFDMERRMYRQLDSAGICYCSIGHRQSLKRFHHLELRLDGEGGWSMSPIDQSTLNFASSIDSVRTSIGTDSSTVL